MATHHIASDAYSERLVHDDLGRAFAGTLTTGAQPSAMQWANRLNAMARDDPEGSCNLSFWLSETEKTGWMPPRRPASAPRRLWRHPLDLDAGGRGRFRADRVAALIAAAVRQLEAQTGASGLWVELTDSGRIVEGESLESVVGCLYYVYPVHLVPGAKKPREELDRVRQALTRIPHRGRGFAALRWVSPDTTVREALARPQAAVSVNIRMVVAPSRAAASPLEWIDRPERHWGFSCYQPVAELDKPLRFIVEVASDRADQVSGYLLADSARFDQAWVESYAIGFGRELDRMVTIAAGDHR